MKKTLRVLLFLFFLGVFLFSAWQLVDILSEYRRGEASYEKLEQYIVIPETFPKETIETKETDPASTEATHPVQESPFPVVDFDALKAINEDVVGWIYIPDTKINYPIVQGENNDQYLYHLLTGDYNSSGSIFLEAGIPSDFSGRNAAVYGHNMKNGTMFADVVGYKDQAFYDAHPVAMLLTPECNYYVHLFSGYVTDSWGDAWQTAFSDSEFEDWLENRVRKSYFSSVVSPVLADRILTLSTCSYEIDDARFVVHGILEQYKK